MSSLQKIPILMYHALTVERMSQVHPIHITVNSFEEQIKWLFANGYQAITINELFKNFYTKKIEDKYCVITFDDGYLSHYKYALPVLKQYGFKATLYLSTITVGEKNFSILESFDMTIIPANDRPLTWDEIKELQQNGWSIQSHSVTHADNSNLNHEQLLFEMTESKRIIEQQLQQPVQHYAFPFGKYNAASLKIVKQAGYKTAVTVHIGLCSASNDLFRLPRIEINANDSLSAFQKKVETGFSSSKEKTKSYIRNILFYNPKVKDLFKKLFSGKIN